MSATSPRSDGTDASPSPDPALPAPFRWEGWHIGAGLAGGRVLFTTRRGGVSEGPFAELNLSRSVEDEAARVDVNRERLAAQVGVGWLDFSFGRQVHRTTARDQQGLWARWQDLTHRHGPGRHRLAAAVDATAALPQAARDVLLYELLASGLDGSRAAPAPRDGAVHLVR